MTIDEAIEILSGYVYEEKPCPVGLFDEATRLGIEALKRVKSEYDPDHQNMRRPLSGETQE